VEEGREDDKSVRGQGLERKLGSSRYKHSGTDMRPRKTGMHAVSGDPADMLNRSQARVTSVRHAAGISCLPNERPISPAPILRSKGVFC
jgi:hypothetical protein